MMSTTDDVTALFEAFEQALHAEDASRHTVSAYCADLQHFLTWLVQTMNICRVDEIMPSDICEYREFLQEQIPPAAPSTINRRLAALRRFFAWGQRATIDGSIPDSLYSHCGKHGQRLTHQEQEGKPHVKLSVPPGFGILPS